ncbi:MAG: hypothetical protein K9I59_00835 [Chlorobium sp.]|jgi:hypothetical protein|nr:hypothetical protein [Chlorobium sp.]MBN1279335.1 hypothetical protein [Chlorobiaceae bacterium]MCF8270236.1 hypothetical protein [Chlorobium sp.]MCF8286605.1 hypothetical protein [Chlorobium sp.]MCF8384363.1 hypothetical protein [Chlorobium sp.]
MMVTGKTHAVLTGDLVKSSRLTSDQSREAMDGLKSAACTFNAVYPEAIHKEMDTFRHDSWQLLLHNPVFAFRAALFFRCVLKMKSSAGIKFDTRISIGIGHVDFLAENRISDSRGPAFTLSGRGLDGMKNAHLAFDGSFADADEWYDVSFGVVPLLDCVVTDWTPVESGAVSAALLGKTQVETVDYLLSKQEAVPSRQAIGDSLSRAHWSTVHDVLARLEEKISGSLHSGYLQA